MTTETQATATRRQLPQRNPLDQISYEDLYERWEKGNWRATEIDFDEDRRQWHEVFTEPERRAALWNYAMFFHGEDSVAENLSPYIDAAPREEHKYFLTTQQVDEARHAVFFGRFMREVVERGGTYGESLAATKPELTWGFRKVFERLDKMADELRKDRSKPKLAQGIALYHLVIEATLAQPGQHLIESYLEREDRLPGFRSGMKNVSLDEQRHIGFGVKLLSELVADDPECKDAVAELLREVMTYSVGVFVPPNWDMSYIDIFGMSLEEIYAEGFKSFESKLRTAGLPLEDMPGVIPIPLELEPLERSQRVIKLLRGNLVGECPGPPSTDPELVGLLFDSVQLTVDPRYSPPRPAVIQWDFTDADPWLLRIDNGNSSVEQARAASPDLTFECSLGDWVGIAAGHEDPRMAMLKRKLRPRGNLRLLLRTRKLFGRG